MTSSGILIISGGCNWHGQPLAEMGATWTLDMSSLRGADPNPLPPWQEAHMPMMSACRETLLLADLCEVQGQVVVFGGHGFGSIPAFDDFGDPRSFADDASAADAGPLWRWNGFLTLAAPLHLAVSSWRAVHCGPRGPAGARAGGHQFRSCGCLTLSSCAEDGIGPGPLVLAATGGGGSSGSADGSFGGLAAFCLRLTSFGPGELELGRAVQLCGLEGRTELNGSFGTCVDYMPSKGRCAVELHDPPSGGSAAVGGRMLSIQPINLRPV